jgi:predicted nucleic acid-binding protein
VILLDSNVWIYLLDDRLPEHEMVRKRLPGLVGRDRVLLPSHVALEVVHYVVRRGPGKAEAAKNSRTAADAETHPLDASTVAEAAGLLFQHSQAGIGGRDAAVLAAARMRGARVASADRALARVARTMGLDVVDPTA